MAVTAQFSAPIDGITASGASSLIINEFMVLPVASSTELKGQYVEIHNRSGEWVNLAGWSLENHQGDTYYFSSYMLPPSAYFVVGACALSSENGGYYPNAVWTSFMLSRYGEVTIYSPDHDYADKVDWNGAWPVYSGASCERINPGWESGLSSSWGASVSTFGQGDYGTPGQQNSVYSNSFAQNSWAFIKAFID
ncbi:MAG: lamin tail domain-containing protein [Candidatus Fermentibacteraceae bacterium]